MYQSTPITSESIESTESTNEKLVNITTNASHVIMEPDLLSPESSVIRIKSILDTYSNELKEKTSLHLGYPYNLDFDVSALNSVQNYSINNLGDPWVESNYGVHSREFEIGVLEWFGKFWNISKSELWGYITNCGTEGNLHGILVGRETLPEGILYFSKDTHYSVGKAAKMYRMKDMQIDVDETGEIDYEHLEINLQKGYDGGHCAILNINVGTTVKGAVDDLDKIVTILEKIGYVHCNTNKSSGNIPKFYIHVDGALFGMMLPFMKDYEKDMNVPSIDFTKPINSISVSGHKFIGAPVPCGVVICCKSNVKNIMSNIEYINSKDSTIMGSRNGHAALFLWYALSLKGMRGLKQDVLQCIENSKLLIQLLEKHNIKCMRNELSSTVVFERPLDHAFVKKYQLACCDDIAHVVVMPSVSEEKLRMFVQDLVKSRESYHMHS